MLGIKDFEPNFFTDPNTLTNVYGTTLLGLIGKEIQDYWVMWDCKENEWYADGPVILKIDNRNFEFCAYQLDEFSLTVDSIDLSKPLDWYGMGDELPLIWKKNPIAEVNRQIGRKIESINILGYNFISTVVGDKTNPENVGQIHETGYMLHGIEFVFEKTGDTDNENYLEIFNALDKNGITTKYLEQDDQVKRLRI